MSTALLVVIPYLRLCHSATSPHLVPHAAHPVLLVILFTASQALLANVLPMIASLLPAHAVLDYAAVTQLTSFGGVTTINIAIALVAAAIHSHWRPSKVTGIVCSSTQQRQSNPDSGDEATSEAPQLFPLTQPHHTQTTPGYSSPAAAAAALLLVLLLTSGGGALYSGSFHAAEVVALTAPELPVACVISQNARPGTPEWERLWQRTAGRVHAGDSIVLWAEESARITSQEVRAGTCAWHALVRRRAHRARLCYCQLLSEGLCLRHCSHNAWPCRFELSVEMRPRSVLGVCSLVTECPLG